MTTDERNGTMTDTSTVIYRGEEWVVEHQYDDDTLDLFQVDSGEVARRVARRFTKEN